MAVDLAQKAQNFTNRGRQALETGRYELAVDMLMEAVSAAPDILETRKLLRAAQIANFKKNGKANTTFPSESVMAASLALPNTNGLSSGLPISTKSR